MRYLGCKRLLLHKIEEIVQKKAPDAKRFCDLFSGTATVARHFKKNYEVISNDFLYFSYVLQKGTIECPHMPEFRKLRSMGIDPFAALSPDIEEMETLPKEKCLFQNTYSPEAGRMYFTKENALRIDYARNKLEEWRRKWLLSDAECEYFYLLTCIIEGIPAVSNISGTYGAFLKNWDKSALQQYMPKELPIIENGRHNQCFNMDAEKLLEFSSGDVLYMDPPYNGRQYSNNYHVLETAARYDFPDVKGVTAQRQDAKRSNLCLKTKAYDSMDCLMEKAKFRHIILSYSTEGILSEEEIENIMKQHGKPETFEMKKFPYRRFKSHEQKDSDLKEIMAYIEKEV